MLEVALTVIFFFCAIYYARFTRGLDARSK
jgi:uncharacterized membrane protein